MKDLLLLFPSIHYVLEAESRLKNLNIEVELIPVPKELSSDCGMALLINAKDWPKVSTLYQAGRLQIEACYLKDEKKYRPFKG